jgi:alpha 1,2-mannosyltransferase
MLARNSDVENVVKAVRAMEDRFNRNFNYPWVFLNDEPFSDDFERCVVGPFFLFPTVVGSPPSLTP